ncbi:MAG TPA: hypothetical protein VE287_13060 [Actinopolymorphaceae bacterium]|nr:hypothetical protein [Actinopolymorphaceae bacterium]
MRSSREFGSRCEMSHGSPSPASDTSALVYPLHGAFAIRDARCGYVVVELQHGFVTAVDDGSVTVTSPDGYTRRYEVGGDDVRTLEVSQGVRLTAGCRLAVAVPHGGPPQVLSIEAPTDEDLGPASSRSPRWKVSPASVVRGAGERHPAKQ